MCYLVTTFRLIPYAKLRMLDNKHNTGGIILYSGYAETVCHLHHSQDKISFNPTALRKAKIVYNFGLSKCNRLKSSPKDKGDKYFHNMTISLVCEKCVYTPSRIMGTLSMLATLPFSLLSPFSIGQ